MKKTTNFSLAALLSSLSLSPLSLMSPLPPPNIFYMCNSKSLQKMLLPIYLRENKVLIDVMLAFSII